MKSKAIIVVAIASFALIISFQNCAEKTDLGAYSSQAGTGLKIVSQTPTTVTALPASDVSFSVTVSPAGNLDYKWYFGSILLTETTSVLTLTNVDTNDNGQYFVIVTNQDDPSDSIASAVMNLTVSGIAVPTMTFTWIAYSNQCSTIANYRSFGDIVDDNDLAHGIREGGNNKPAYRLCGTGFTDSLWASSCPSGYFDTQLYDDDDSNHNLTETGGDTTAQRLCVQGATAVTWATTCPPGYGDTSITDTTATTHSLTESASGVGSYKMCVR